MRPYRERVLQIGRDRALTGILCEPARGPARARRMVLFWNAGLLHHVGPNRLFVEIARALALAGISSFRFDLSGYGDSEARNEERSERERSVAEVREVMDHMHRTREVEGFVLLGLCSSADEAHRVSVADERVKGVIHLDGYGRRTSKYYLHFYGKRALKPGKWIRAFQRASERLLPAREPASAASGLPVIFERDFPTLDGIRADLQGLVRRGVRSLYLYTGGVPEYYCYEGQFDDMFADLDFRGLVEAGFFPRADHLYSQPESRRELLERVSAWVQHMIST